MKTLRSILSVIAILGVEQIRAATITIDGVTWSYEQNGSSVRVGVYNETAIPTDTTGDIVIPSEINGYAVTEINQGAFLNCSHLTSITLPESVTTIGDYAFEGCSSLNAIEIPKNVSSVGYELCYGCYGLETVIVRSKSIYDIAYVFYGCSNVTTLKYIDDGHYYGRYLGQSFPGLKCVELLGGSTRVSEQSFYNLTSLTNVVLAETVNEIGRRAFCGCSKLEGIYGLESIEIVGDEAFADCVSLKELVFSDSLLRVGNYAFAGCSNIESIDLPSSLQYQGRYIFEGCKKLKMDLIISGTTWVDDSYARMEGITSVVFEEGVQRIDWGAFEGCTGITNLVFPSSLMEIGHRAFRGCTGLVNVVIPENVRYLDSYAFGDCLNLEEVTLLSGNIFPMGYPFENCPKLRTLNVGAFSRYRGMSQLIWPPNGQQRVEVNILPGVTEICDYGLEGFYAMGTLNMPNGLTNIGYSAVSHNYNLTNVVFAAGLTSIENYAFSDDRALTEISLPSGLESIGDFAFSGTSLSTVSIPASVKKIGERAFGSLDVQNIHFESGSDFVIEEGVLFQVSNGVKKVLIQASEALTGVYEIPNTVERIAGRAFQGCNNLSGVIIPEGITTIPQWMLSGCTNISVVTIPSSVTNINSTAFRSINFSAIEISANNEKFYRLGEWLFERGDEGEVLIGLDHNYEGEGIVNIPRSVSEIASSACRECNRMRSLIIPSSVKQIDAYAFYDCCQLENVEINTGVEGIGNYSFAYCTNLVAAITPSSVKVIGNYAFYQCGRLQTVSVAAGDIGNYAFYYCNGLENVVCGNGVTSIGAEAFYNCTNLLTAVLGRAVSNVGNYAFQNCSRLKSVDIASGDIGQSAFSGCGQLSSLALRNGVTSIGGYAFYNCTNLLTAVLGGAVSNVGNYAFQNCSRLKSVDIASGDIGQSAFRGCGQLSDLILRNGVVSIGDYAFYDCNKLRSVLIPDSVTSIGYSAFRGCSGLESVTFMGNAPRVDSYAFVGVNSSCVASVSPKATGWGVGVGEKWNGLMFQHWPEILTEASSDTEVSEIVATFADKGLAAQVTNKVEYDAFRVWVNDNNIHQPTVVDCKNTWLSYALGADALIEKAITSNDVQIVGFEVVDGGALGPSRPTSFAFEVAIDGVNIGGGSVAVEMLKENLKKVLGIEGAATLSLDGFSSDNIDITFDAPVDGKARLTVTPPADVGNSFFMRVKVK